MVTPILISVLLIWGCASTVHPHEKSSDYLSKQKRVLTDKQIQSLDAHAVKALPECFFIYDKKPDSIITNDTLDQCIYKVSNWFNIVGYKILGLSDAQTLTFHEQLVLKFPSGLPDNHLSRFHILDDYLGKRIIPYISAMPKQDQEKLVRQIFFSYSDNLSFIKTMINKGLVKNVLLIQIGEGGNKWASCQAYMLILKKNIELYKDKKTLYEPVPDYEGRTGAFSSYRWMDLYHLTDPAYNICPEVIERLVRANPEFLNKKRDSWSQTTPLNQFLSAPQNTPKRFQIIKMLTTPVNINLKNGIGNTPLHTFLGSHDPTTANNLNDSDKQIVQWLIEQGADINLKNNKGISAKELILKRPDLSGLLK